MNSYIKVRTFIALAIIAIFAFAIYPLTPKDFYETLKKHAYFLRFYILKMCFKARKISKKT